MPQVTVALNRALIARGRRKGLLWDEPAPLGTAVWGCCGPTCPPCTALPRRRSRKHIPTVTDEHHPDHQPHQSPRHHCTLPRARVWEKGKAGSPGAVQPSSVVCKGPFPEGITVCPKGPRPSAFTLPTPLRSRAWPRCSQGSCMGQNEIQQSPESPSTPHTGWQHLGHDKALATSAFLLPSPSTITCMGRSPTGHTVSPGPAGATTAVPTTVSPPPSPGSGKRISGKGSSCGSCSHPVVQAGRVRSRAAPGSPGYRMITSQHSLSTRLPAMQGCFLCFGKTRGEQELFWHVLARPEAVPHLHRLGEEPSPLPHSQ